LSVRFCDACQGGGAYGKTASPWPYRFTAKLLPGISQEISAPPVSWYRSPQPNDRA